MNELKPCPFCGSNEVRLENVGGEDVYYYIECQSCGAATGLAFGKDEAIKNWNRRAEENAAD